MNSYSVEYTDTFGGEANYSWVRRAVVTMPELTHYGYDGATGYTKANRSYQRELMRKSKAAVHITGLRGRAMQVGETIEFKPNCTCTVMFITPCE